MKPLKLFGKIFVNVILILGLLYFLILFAWLEDLVFILAIIACIYFFNSKFSVSRKAVCIGLVILIFIGYYFVPKTITSKGSNLGAVEHKYKCPKGFMMGGFSISCVGSKNTNS